MSTTWHDDYTTPGWVHPKVETIARGYGATDENVERLLSDMRLHSVSLVPAEQALQPEWRVTVGAHDTRPPCSCVGGPHGGYTCPECR